MSHQETQSVCPKCLRRLPAKRIEKNGNIYLERTCPEHGFFSALIWEGTPGYWEWNKEHSPTRTLTNEGVRAGCPFDCGICGQHQQETCCVLLEITQRCNMCCSVCFADSGCAADDPSIECISNWYDTVLEKAGKANIQLSGGEPTLRNDLPQIIRIGKEKGFTYFQLNTNGRRLARDPLYAQELKDAGLNCVFLQFDGLSDEVYEILRGAPLYQEKLHAIANCAAAKLSVILVPTLVPDINLDQIGAIIDFAINMRPAVHGVHFQPIAYFGRYFCDESKRLTLPRLLREIEKQTDGMFTCNDFISGTAEHSLCSFSGNFLINEDRTMRVLKGNRNCCHFEKSGKNAVEHVRDTVASRWGAQVSDNEIPPEDLNSLDGMIYQLHHNRFSISAMSFQDCWSLDLERLKNCYINIMSQEGKLIPFCAYNLTNEDGRPLYRINSMPK